MKNKSLMYIFCVVLSLAMMGGVKAIDLSNNLSSDADKSAVEKTYPKPHEDHGSLTVTDYLWHLAPIKSQEDLIALSNQPSSLDALSNYHKEMFVKSVQFGKDGVGGYYYGGLEAELTPTQIYSILALIGKQADVVTFKDARIETKADTLLLVSPKISSHDNEDLVKAKLTGFRNEHDTHGPGEKDMRCSGAGECGPWGGYTCSAPHCTGRNYSDGI
ncbi:hypothetical protein N9M08_08175 [Porticoccaceae bacterium]|nr:hypothetical protein [Porticoccaceae bacterium]MDB2343469.1 hypothetical protein [Porticoccaceae bacterium]MDB2634532.1 hypothetical protein [Porticoccaceae bacterium]